MKKIISLMLAIALVLTACVSITAFAADIDPYNSAEDSLISGSGYFWSMALNQHSAARDKDYGSKIDYTFNDDEIAWNPASDQADAADNAVWSSFGMCRLGCDHIPISINGVADTEDSIYTTILAFNCTPDVEINSFTIAIAGKDTAWADCVFDGFTLFASDVAWREVPDYKAPAASPSSNEFTQVAKVTGLISGNKWKDSEDGLFRYYEANFDEPFEAAAITIAWTAEDVANITNLKSEGKISNALIPLTEVAVFEDAIPGAAVATEAPKATEAPAAATEAPKATEAPAEPGKAPAGFVNASFDNIEFNEQKNFGADDGVASTKMQVVDGSKGDIAEIILRGWAGFDQAITSYGYRVNGTDVFVEGDPMTLTTENEVRDAEKGGGENGLRFQVKIPTADLKGENTIVVIAKLADGTVVAIDNSFDAYVHGYATASPNTTFTYKGVEGAAATEEPKATESPKATEAPAAATETPKATEEPAKKGCGSTVACGAIAVLAACALVIRKKED